MSWAQRLKRVFRIEIETCEHCGGRVQVIASIEDAAVIGRILAHRHQVAAAAASSLMEGGAAHRARGPPGQGELALE